MLIFYPNLHPAPPPPPARPARLALALLRVPPEARLPNAPITAPSLPAAPPSCYISQPDAPLPSAAL